MNKIRPKRKEGKMTKEQLLRLLESSETRYISSKNIAKELNCSPEEVDDAAKEIPSIMKSFMLSEDGSNVYISHNKMNRLKDIWHSFRQYNYLKTLR